MIYGRRILLEPVDNIITVTESAEKRFSIKLKATRKSIGEVNYCGYSPIKQEVEIGIEIFNLWRGQGYGEDALYHFLQYLFHTLHVKLVKLSVIHDNFPARQLYEKLGFSIITVVEHGGYDVEKEEFVDLAMMQLTNIEWYNDTGFRFKNCD